MSSEIQRKNHRIHPCNAHQKNAILASLIEKYPHKKILVVTANDLNAITLSPSNEITILSDDTLASVEKARYDVLVSYDLPDKAILYMSRFAHAREHAIILLSEEDQKNLYPIETLLGRTIIQESLVGFEPNFGIAIEQKNKAEALARRAQREEEATNKPDKWGKKGKSTSEFLGKDANGKPIFGAKSRERNHYIDGTPRSAEEKATRSKYVSKPVFFGDAAKKEVSPKAERKPYGEKKEFSDKKPFGDKKPYSDKKPYGEKKEFGDKKPFEDKKPYGDKKPYNDRPKPKAEATPSRPPRRINVKSLKPSDEKQ